MRLIVPLLTVGAALQLCACGGASDPVSPLPSVSLNASMSSIDAGDSAMLMWTSSYATSCSGSGGWSGTLATNGSQSTGALATTATFSLTCAGPGGTSPPAATTITVNPLPSVSLTAMPTAVPAGGSATLTWSSNNATACTASGGWSGSVDTGGNQNSGAITAPTTFALVCTGPGGTSMPAIATINIIPTATLTALPSVIAPGGATTLAWSSSYATACTALAGWSGPLAVSGTQGSGTLSASTVYSLSCSGPGGTSSVASATVTVSGLTMSLTPSIAAITLGRTQQFTAIVPGGGAATWSVDGIVNGNSVVGTVSATGLYTAGTAGTHTIVATSVANSSQAASAIAAVTDFAGVFTYHNDIARDGANSQEYALTPGNVSAGTFGKLASCAVDGAIYSQPLWVANLTVNGAPHNVVFVTTQHDSLFAFDGDSISCTPLWSISLIDAAHGGTGGETSVPNTLVGVGYGDIQPEIGVTGTPVIDAASDTLYVVSKSVNSGQTIFYQRLHAIDITTGNEKSGAPALIAGTVQGTGDGSGTVTFNTKQQNQRGGLALVNGTVYIIWSSHEDSSPWYGWIMAYQYASTGFTQTGVFNSTPNVQRGGIWMGGGAPAVDSANNLYVLTGNGNFDANMTTAPNNDYGDSLLQLNTTLQVTQYFTPSDELSDVNNDADFASGGAAVLADLPAGNTVTHALVCGGKDGTLYVINRDVLGGFGDSNAVQTLHLGHGLFATSAFWNNQLFVAGAGGPLVAYQLTPATVQFNLASSSTQTYGFPGSTPAVSAAAAQNGLVWALNNNSYCTHQSSSCGPAVLHVYATANLANELWNSSMNAGDSAGNAVKFSVPTVANGRVYVGTRGNNTGGADNSTSTPGELEIYGLKQP